MRFGNFVRNIKRNNCPKKWIILTVNSLKYFQKISSIKENLWKLYTFLLLFNINLFHLIIFLMKTNKKLKTFEVLHKISRMSSEIFKIFCPIKLNNMLLELSRITSYPFLQKIKQNHHK